MSLANYRKRRRFDKSPEPEGRSASRSGAAAKRRRGSSQQLQFVVQKHAASRLHYDFRLELEGVLKSWAVPKGPCLDPAVKRLAVQVEDHPLEYAKFEGSIPQGEYGGGEVIVWDRGAWQPSENPVAELRRGKLEFELTGQKLRGGWVLVQTREPKSEEMGKNWLLIKRVDKEARPLRKYDVAAKRPESVNTGRNLEDLRANGRPAKNGTNSRSRRMAAMPKRGAARSKHRSRRGKKNSQLPESIDVQLATQAAEPPAGDQWLHEIKFDGYRLVARVQQGDVQLLTRNRLDWTQRYPAIASALADIPAETAILDGEVVAQFESGRTSFQALQNALRQRDTHQLIYYAFDLLFLDGHDLRTLPLRERKAMLEHLLEQSEHPQLQFSGHYDEDGSRIWQACCEQGLEGIVSKRRDRPYLGGRGTDWLKIKCLQQEELVIGGFTLSPAKHREFGALLVGFFEDNGLVYAGRVGTGFDTRLLADLRRKLDRLQISSSPFTRLPARQRSGPVRWAKPQLVAQVEFTGWTNDGVLRHPSFQGLREDKSAAEVGRPDSLKLASNLSSAGHVMNGSAKREATSREGSGRHSRKTTAKEVQQEVPIHLTNPDRVLFPDAGLTKRNLVNYYTAISDFVLPHLKDRPLSLLRCPEGHAKACFFQKHAAVGTPQELRRIDVSKTNEPEIYLIADDLPGLLSLAQMSVLEIHPWGSRSDRLEHPDLLIFDLDPGEGVEWKDVVRAGFVLRDALDAAGLKTFAKLTGGKGLHLVAPLSPRRHDWDEVKSFARSVAEHFEAEEPQRYISTMSKAKRRGRIFIDYLRNGRGATAIAPYSTRAKPGAPVACPISWDELSDRRRSDHFTIQTLPRRLRNQKSDPWEGFFRLKQALPKAVN